MMDEMVKLPEVYRHYKKYKWVKDLTEKTKMEEKNDRTGKDEERLFMGR